MAEIGVFTLESLTVGMYDNPLVIYREYIQNSCDSIDKAFAEKILAADDSKIKITIDRDARRITIEDNGTGISVLDFKSKLSDVGYSDKIFETVRGFRGIGRLCGLAYCRELRFTSTARGEGVQSTAIFNAEKLRSIFYSKKKYTMKEAIDEITSFDTVAFDSDEHFFRVELIDIVDTNKTLLDVEKVRDYLSFVAPVTYSPQLYFQTQIYEYAKSLNFKLAEYKIEVNGQLLDKPYKVNEVQTRLGKDDIFGVAFRDFKDAEGNLIAWSWIGLSNFKGVLNQKTGTSENLMRGIRLRAGNIQIGNADVFKNLFSDVRSSEGRGTDYFIGEVHAVDANLTPNSQRSYFEENDVCNVFEDALKKYFEELIGVYRTASDLRSAYKAVNAPAEAENEFRKKSAPYRKSHQAEHDIEVAKLKEAAESAEKKISSMRQKAEKDEASPLSRVVLRMTKETGGGV